MAQEPDAVERVKAHELESGDVVIVHVNERAAKHLGERSFEATVEDSSFGDVVFRPTEQLQNGYTTHTWHADNGYIHGKHTGLGRYSDIGKVRKVER